MWDRDQTDGELVEAEVAMFAQDVAGNVWHFGQYPEVYPADAPPLPVRLRP